MTSLPSCTVGTERHVLSNGLTVLIQPYRAAPVVAVVTHVKTGYFDEPDHWVGISHVLEHMYFKGTARRGVGDMARETKQAGGYLNAATSYDRTQYYTVLPADQLTRAIDIQSDALLASVIDAGELEREIEVIVQEANRKLDTPSAVMAETLYGLLFDQHRMRRWRIGEEDQLRRLTRDDVVAFYTTRYVPANTIVSLVGDLDPDRALAAVVEHYGTAQPRPLEADPSPAEIDHVGFRSRILQGDVQQSIVGIGWRTFGSDDPRTPALDVLPWILGVGRGSWGYQTLRAPGLARSVGCSHYTPTEIGVFQLSSEMASESAATALPRLWSLVDRVHTKGAEGPDLDRAKALALSHFAHRFETVDGRATALAMFEALGGYEKADEYIEAFFRTEACDLTNAARDLTLERAAAVAFVPQSGDPGLPENLLDVLRHASPPALTAPTARSRPPEIRRSDVAITWHRDVAVVRGNCVDVITLRKPHVPLVTLGVVTAGAPRLEREHNAGISLLTLRSALRGAGAYDRDTLAAAAEHLGGVPAALVSSDWAGWSMTVRAGALDTAAALLADVASDAHFVDAEVTREQQLLRQDARRLRDDMYHYPIRLALRAALPNDAYGLPLVGTVESVDGLRRDAVREWHHDELRARRLTVLAVGDLDAAREAARLNELFGDWSGAGGAKGVTPRWRAGQELHDHRDKEQSAIALAFAGPGRQSPDRFVVEIISIVASGLGGRFFEEIRDRRALAYTVSALPWFARDAGAIIGYVATSPGRLDEAREAMLLECRRFADSSVTTDELQRAIRYAIGMRQVRRQRGVSLFGELLSAHLGGGSITEWGEDEAALERVTANDVQRVAGEVFSRSPSAGVVTGTAD